MSGYGMIHERFMRASRTILPRVGGGVGVGGRGGFVGHPCVLSHQVRALRMDGAYGGDS